MSRTALYFVKIPQGVFCNIENIVKYLVGHPSLEDKTIELLIRNSSLLTFFSMFLNSRVYRPYHKKTLDICESMNRTKASLWTL